MRQTLVKTRYHQVDRVCSPGQLAVLYDGEVCLGDGVIV